MWSRCCHLVKLVRRENREQEGSGLKKSDCKLNIDWDPANAELSNVVQYLDKFNDMCVVKVMPAAEPCSPRVLKEALSNLSESALLQWTQTMQRVNINQHETPSSNIASAKDALEDVAAKIASISVDAASLAGQIAFSDSGLTAAASRDELEQRTKELLKEISCSSSETGSLRR